MASISSFRAAKNSLRDVKRQNRLEPFFASTANVSAQW
jgi:hypothetical protein